MSPAAKPQLLTTAEFHAAVHALAPEVAVFDCDGTLWSGDAGTGFMRWTVDGGLLSRKAIDWLDDRYRAYLRGEVSELAICGEMVQIYQGLRESEMRAAAAEFFATRIEPNLFPEMLTQMCIRDRLGPDTYLLTYNLQQGPRFTRRTTIWQHSPEGWLVVYHQGTIVSANEDDVAPPQS